MTAKGFVCAEDGHIVNILPPIDAHSGGAKSSDVFSLREHAHCSILIQMGVVSTAVPVLTLVACSDFTPSSTSALPFALYKYETAAYTAGADVSGGRAAEPTTGYQMALTNSIMYAIEIDAAELPAGYPNLQLKFTDPGYAVMISAVAILSGSRFGVAISDTEIA